MDHRTLIAATIWSPMRHDVLKMEDLQTGMILQGTVRNVVDFGAFVDIGVKQDGLVHISEMADRFVKDPLSVVAVGQVVQVRGVTPAWSKRAGSHALVVWQVSHAAVVGR